MVVKSSSRKAPKAKKDVWYLSKNGITYEVGPYKTVDKATEAASEMWKTITSDPDSDTDLFSQEDVRENDSVFYVGKRIWWWPSVSAEEIICQAQEDAYEYAGEHSEGWLDNVTAGQKRRLQKALQEAFDDWVMFTCNKPPFFMVEPVAEHQASELV